MKSFKEIILWLWKNFKIEISIVTGLVLLVMFIVYFTNVNSSAYLIHRSIRGNSSNATWLLAIILLVVLVVVRWFKKK